MIATFFVLSYFFELQIEARCCTSRLTCKLLWVLRMISVYLASVAINQIQKQPISAFIIGFRYRSNCLQYKYYAYTQIFIYIKITVVIRFMASSVWLTVVIYFLRTKNALCVVGGWFTTNGLMKMMYQQVYVSIEFQTMFNHYNSTEWSTNGE